jgi:hypothetical protein
MTVQPDTPAVEAADITPERRPGAGDWLSDPDFQPPERVPWSELQEDFMGAWADPPWNKREHWEIIGPTGSGKTYLMETALQERYRRNKTGAILVCTKEDDDMFREMGWPIVSSPGDIRDTNVIFWPRTSSKGSARKEFLRSRIQSLLDQLWQPGADTIVAFDEVNFVEKLSGELRDTIQMYWREARSVHIQMIAMKQRPQGTQRDMHSETMWTAVFKPLNRPDAEVFAELLGAKRDWMPVLDGLDLDAHEFVIRHSRSQESYISWVDVPLRPQKIQRKGLLSLVSR